MALLGKVRMTKDLGVATGALLLAKGGHNTDKTLVVLHPPLCSTSPLFLLFGHLGGLNSYFPSTGQGAMDFTSQHVACYFQTDQRLYPRLTRGSLIL